MNERNNKLELLGSAPIPKALMALGIPIMIGMLINALYNLVDAYFVSGLGKSQMGAISIVFPLGQVVVGLGLMFGNGAASYLSRLLGRGDKDTADKVASTALYSSILIGAIIILLSTIFLKPILVMLGATETIMPYALTYARIYVLSCIFNVFNVTMNNIVSSEGAAKTTMCALLLGAVLNIGLDPLFIYILDMGVEGAAIATAISQMVSTLVYLTYVLRKKSVFSFSIKEFSPTRQMVTEILKIGVPTLVFQLLTSLSIALINRASSNYGDSVIAGMGAVTRITSMGTLVVFGFLKGFQPIAGFSYGAKKFDRLREAIKNGVLAGYPMVNLKATLFDGKYHPVDSKEIAFITAAKLSYNEACMKANPCFLEPIMDVKITIPDSYMGDIMGDITKRRGRIIGTDTVGKKMVLTAEAPMAEMFRYATDLNSMTQGRGRFKMSFNRYEEVPSTLSAKIIEDAKKRAAEAAK